jgi:CO/xanthine dehydrogenase Mo-binding subunit
VSATAPMERAIDSRPDAHGKAAARAYYSQDLYRPGMLHGVVLRSPHAAAEIQRIDLAPALALPGVVTALGADEVPDTEFGIVEADERLLARGRVRYVGEPVALVAAGGRAEAEAAAARIDVSFRPLPAAIDLGSALADDAPPVRPGEPNLIAPSELARGDVAGGFERAETVVRTTVRSQRVHQGYIELRAALAELDDEGRLIVTMSSQAPFQVRQTLSRIFAIPMTRVVVRVPAFGGGFGGKLHNGMAPYAAALCLATGRPVQVISTRAEELQAGNPRENSLVTLESALDAEGRIVARRATGYYDSGAYTYDTPYITSMGAMQAGGPYAVGAVEAKVHAVRTNTQPTGSFRAPSGPQMCFANEVHMDEIAARLEIDRIELRRRNMMRAGDLGPTGQELADSALGRCLDEAERLLEGWRADPGEEPARDSARGLGLACAWWFTAPGGSAATVRLEEDGTATVACGATEIGTGAVVSGLTSLVATELGLGQDQVRLITASTDSAPPDFGSEGSRTLYGAGNAVLQATAECRRILLDQAAQEMEASPEDLIFRERRIQVAGSPEASIALAEIGQRAALAGGPIVGTGRFQAAPTQYIDGCATGMLIPTFNEPTFHCHVADVEVDLRLGSVRVLRYAAIHDTGPVISWSGVKGQIEGGVVQGLGYALYEEMDFDGDGRVRNANLVDYRLPTIADVPDEMLVVPIEDFPSKSGPRGAKGIGEAPVILPAATMASAIRDATGVTLTDLPLRPQRVLASIEQRVSA